MNNGLKPIPSPFAILAHTLIGRITKKSYFTCEYVRLGEFLMVSQSLFETGVIAAYIFHDRLPILMKLFAEVGTEEECLKYFGQCATERMATVGGQCRSFMDVFFFPEMRNAGLPREWAGLELVRVARQKISISSAFLKMQFYGAEGIGFGFAYPELSMKLLEESVKPHDPVEWSKWRSHGLDISEKPPQETLDQREEMVKGLIAEHISQFRPDLIEPLGLNQ